MITTLLLAAALSGAEIDATVHKKADELRDCYEEGLARKPRLRGKVTMKMKVERDGSVHEAGLAKSTLRDEQVERCLVGVFETMHFPAFGPPCADGADCRITVTYPLHFEPAS